MAVLLLIVIVLGCVLVAFGFGAILLPKISQGSPSGHMFGHKEPKSLFDTEAPEAPEGKSEDDLRAELFQELRSGKMSALDQANDTTRPEVYRALLDQVVAEATDEQVTSLVAHISRSQELRTSAGLVRRLIGRFQSSPSVRSATELLHFAALSDNAVLYHEAVDLLIATWKGGKLPRLSASDLKELIESQFWVLAPEARQGGDGFQLKRKLAGIRRELATAQPVR